MGKKPTVLNPRVSAQIDTLFFDSHLPFTKIGAKLGLTRQTVAKYIAKRKIEIDIGGTFNDNKEKLVDLDTEDLKKQFEREIFIAKITVLRQIMSNLDTIKSAETRLKALKVFSDVELAAIKQVSTEQVEDRTQLANVFVQNIVNNIKQNLNENESKLIGNMPVDIE